MGSGSEAPSLCAHHRLCCLPACFAYLDFLIHTKVPLCTYVFIHTVTRRLTYIHIYIYIYIYATHTHTHLSMLGLWGKRVAALGFGALVPGTQGLGSRGF